MWCPGSAAWHPGSSPHTRGTHSNTPSPIWRMRFIPAYAGNAPQQGPWRPPCPVHPRIRGERDRMRVWLPIVTGSSPHTRGTRPQATGMVPVARFIPAYAGNASGSVTAAQSTTVHPRIRGERPARQERARPLRGSSPHTRGTLTHNTPGLRPRRFIPAYAGNARHPATGPRERSVHPRIRGERKVPTTSDAALTGSSPHTRGTRNKVYAYDLLQRFIPAYAGNAINVDTRKVVKTVHPRIRGERAAARAMARAERGSSPHTRGTRAVCGSNPWLTSVHPRIRGERMCHPSSMAMARGSSPHTRGTHGEGHWRQ